MSAACLSPLLPVAVMIPSLAAFAQDAGSGSFLNPFYFLMLVSVSLASAAQILLKKSASRPHKNALAEYLNPFVIGGYGMLGVSMLLTMYCYRGLDYMQVIVFEPLGYIIVMFLSRLFFAERVTRPKLLGMALIIGGILLYNI